LILNVDSCKINVIMKTKTKKIDPVFKKVFKIKITRQYTGAMLPQRSFKAPNPKRLPLAMTRKKPAFIHCIENSTMDGSDRYARRVEARFIDEKVGYGVFAKKGIPKGEVLGVYTGKLKLLEGDSHSKYLFSFHAKALKDVLVDGKNAGNWTGLMNHSPYKSKMTNVDVKEFFYNGLPYIIFFAYKPIRKGEQLLYDYGDDYWDALSTKPKDLQISLQKAAP